MAHLDAEEDRSRQELVSREQQQARPAERLKRKVVRAGWIVFVVGVVVTLIGTRQLAVARSSFSGGGREIHTVGLLILLGGGLIALSGYRLPWLFAVARLLSSMDDETGAAVRSRTAAAARKVWLSTRLVILILVVGVALWALSVVAVTLLPEFIAGFILVALTLILCAGSIILIASGPRLQRAFGVGAVMPLIMAVGLLWVHCVSLFGPGSRFPSYSRYRDSFPERIGDDIELTARFTESVGVILRAPILALWITALIMGIVAIGMRMALSAVTREDRASLSDSAADSGD